LPLEQHGVRWIYPTHAAAHPLPDGSAIALDRSIEVTAEQLGPDAKAYIRLMQPLVRDWDKLGHEFLGPLRFPHYPFVMARFGVLALQSLDLLAHLAFR